MTQVGQSFAVREKETVAPSQTNTNIAHLLSQIKFLHGEVDRLEEQMGSVRSNALKQAKQTATEYERVIEQKNAELNEWRSKSGSLRGDVDLQKRCAALEKQLALANSEKSVVSMEKNDLFAKVRRLETQLKTKKSEVNEAAKSASNDSAAHKEQLSKLSAVIQKLTEENASLKTRVHDSCACAKKASKPAAAEAATETDNATRAFGTQTAGAHGETRDAECQVDTALGVLNTENQSLHALYQSLESKTQEADEHRANLEDLQAVQQDTLRVLEVTKKRLTEEVERRRLISDDAEKLSIQLRSLQKKSSDQAAAERDLTERVHVLEEQRQQFRIDAMRMEREHTEVVSQLRQYERDMEHLSSNKNYSNQQLSVLANENENARAEVQKLLVRESQLAFSLKSKEGEMQEILEAYQNAAKETEAVLERQRFLERELDNVRATLASKDEGIIFLQEQVTSLHQREQQLILDLQTLEYENDQLHRKIIQSDSSAGQLEAKCRELQQFVNARDQVVEEMHQSLAELSKQVVIRENEAMLLRRRCDGLEHDVMRLQAVATNETARNRDLEEMNARLVTRDVLSSFSNTTNADTAAQELETVSAQLLAVRTDAKHLTERLDAEEERRKTAELELSRAKAKLSAANESNERLEKIVMDQNRALMTLSK